MSCEPGATWPVEASRGVATCAADGPPMVSLILGSASDRCVPEREGIRELVLESFTSRS